jgi:GTP-binding protein EngB required for normal cell division
MNQVGVFFAGRSNAGKSTVIKVLFGLKTRTGRQPGVTRAPIRYELEDVEIIDLPGIGFRRGLKEYKSMLLDILDEARARRQPAPLGVQIIDAKSFLDVSDRHSKPLDVNLFESLLELQIDPIVAINKMDKIVEREASLDKIVLQLGMLPPYGQWIDRVVPLSAKKHEVAELKWLISHRLQCLRDLGEVEAV